MKRSKTLVIEVCWHSLMGEIKTKSELMVNYHRETAPLTQEVEEIN